MQQRFGIIASDPLRLLGMRTLFEEKEADVVVLAGNDASLMPKVALVLIDAACTENLFAVIAELRQSQPVAKLVVVGLERDEDSIARVIGAGARGYLTHDAGEAEILMAIDIVLDGSVWAPRKVLARLIENDQITRERLAAKPVLTRRESDVLDRLVSGMTNRQIGQFLKIDEATVKAHVGRLMRKAGVVNRTALSVRATEWQAPDADDQAAGPDASTKRSTPPKL